MKTYKQYNITPARGQALLNFSGRRLPDKIEVFEAEAIENVKNKQNEALPLPNKETELNPDFTNLLIQGDCLSACAYLKSKNIKIDLVYIDPPFASGANYAKKIYLRNGNKSDIGDQNTNIGEEIMYGDIWQKEDYLNWLYERLLAIREVMSETGSIYVHLDWHIGHYVKIMMDEIFGEENFRNEIIWCYSSPSIKNHDFPKKHENIYRYSKSDEYYANFEDIRIPYKKLNTGTSNAIFKEDYRLDERGKIPEDWWEISPVGRKKEELSNYATQKPEAILQRIIKASSDAGMIVADFFSGSGTTVKVASDLKRQFIACDIGINAVQTTRDRLAKSGASFDILKIKDGLRLFRNPEQTAAKIFGIIEGFKSAADFDLNSFWDGGIAQADGSYTPVKFSGIQDKLTKELLDVYLEEIYKLEDTAGGNKNGVIIIYAHKEIEINQKHIDKAIKDAGKTDLKAKLICLDDILAEKKDSFFTEDNADISVNKQKGKYKVKINKYFSPYLKNKLEEYNAKKIKKGTLKQDLNKAVEISENGLELIEAVQFDTTLAQVWKSESALEDKAGIKEKIKGEYRLNTDKFKIKIRNIAGDEIIIESDKLKSFLKRGIK
ncbi:MAG: site-specific DNA-methyltransferase [Deltaproteobacteria bacterium]|nr:site-specific DNA-methyltransferase [Deltaproteobacteria bacterium]